MGLIEEVQAKAEAEVARIQQEADSVTLATHFYGSPPQLRNDSTEHGSTLTDEEREALGYLCEGKSIPKKLIEDSGGKPSLKGGILSVVKAVARVFLAVNR